jgi:hypothetical protein
MTTTNFSEFGSRELAEAGVLLNAYSNRKSTCPYFSGSGVQVIMNKNSGYVFLTDDDCNVLMMNGNSLEGFYTSPYEGYEGFFDELVDYWDASWHKEDTEWLYQLAKDLNELDELPKELLTELNYQL